MEWWNITIVIAAGLLTVFNLGDKIASWISAQKTPTNNLELRVEKLEKTVEFEYRQILTTYEQRFSNDLQRLNKMEEQGKLTQRTLLALTRHAMNGNNLEELREVEKELSKSVWG